jgi:hypothetical protein
MTRVSLYVRRGEAVGLLIPSLHPAVPQTLANFGIETLADARLLAHYRVLKLR